ncbi:macrophage mannose receptor 1-like [Asterias rubens]|uniref:macrophage mannose receptor 1-like n=1 Tax=Asterias rubens TaxID=7604 RepID=UPI0014552A17|nr:macrophage mannose receptor 1-like [Asterias rubens]
MRRKPKRDKKEQKPKDKKVSKRKPLRDQGRTPGRDKGKKPKKDKEPKRKEEKGEPRKTAPRILKLGSGQVTFSSIYKNYDPTSGKKIWIPDYNNDVKPSLVVTFKEPRTLTSIQAKGAKVKELGEGWIKDFRLETKATKDSPWVKYTLEDKTDLMTFEPEVTSAKATASFTFPSDITAEKLRFTPVSWEKFPAIRMKLLGYRNNKKETGPKRRQKRTIYYRLWNNEASWEEASKYCSEQDGRLAKIEDASVQKRLVRSIKRKGFKADWWIGVSDKETEDTWLWSDGTQMTYTNWLAGVTPPQEEIKDCAFMKQSEDYLWDDEVCDLKKSFICEYDEKPKKSSSRKVITDVKVGQGFNYYMTSLTWKQALRACVRAQGTLARIQTEETQKAIEEYIATNFKDTQVQFWFDANYRVTHRRKEDWVFSNGVGLDYDNGLKEVEVEGRKCAHLGTKTEPQFQWTADKCREKRGFICEIFPKDETSVQPARDEGSSQVYLSVQKSKQTWEEAKDDCQKANGHLVRIYDASFQTKVENSLDEVGAKRKGIGNGRTIEPAKRREAQFVH